MSKITSLHLIVLVAVLLIAGDFAKGLVGKIAVSIAAAVLVLHALAAWRS